MTFDRGPALATTGLGRLVLVALAASVIAGACRESADDGSARSPGRSPRHADVEGIVTAVDLHHLAVDGVAYPVSPKLRSFAAGTLQTVPLLWRAGQYVQVGLSGRTVTWIEGIGAVVRSASHPPTVYFNETLRRVSGGLAIFADGTVLHIDPSASSPRRLPAPVHVEIDPASHRIRLLALTTT